MKIVRKRLTLASVGVTLAVLIATTTAVWSESHCSSKDFTTYGYMTNATANPTNAYFALNNPIPNRGQGPVGVNWIAWSGSNIVAQGSTTVQFQANQIGAEGHTDTIDPSIEWDTMSMSLAGYDGGAYLTC